MKKKQIENEEKMMKEMLKDAIKINKDCIVDLIDNAEECLILASEKGNVVVGNKDSFLALLSTMLYKWLLKELLDEKELKECVSYAIKDYKEKEDNEEKYYDELEELKKMDKELEELDKSDEPEKYLDKLQEILDYMKNKFKKDKE